MSTVDHGERGDQQHDQDHRAALQGEVHNNRVPEDSPVRTDHDHDGSGPGRLPHQGAAHQLLPSQLAPAAAAELH